MAIGWVGSDITDWVGGAVSDAADTFGEVAKVIPFSSELGGAMKDLINGPLRDFARTPYGLVVLRAMAGTIYGPLAWTLGPQIASLAFALPGVVRGDEFWHAYITEVEWRAQKTAEILAPSAADAITPRIQEAADALSTLLPEQVRSMALSELAARLHVDEWTVAMAESLLGLIPIPSRNAFEPVSGKFIQRVGKIRIANAAPDTRTVCEKAQSARDQGLPDRIVQSLENQCAARNAPAAVAGGVASSSAPAGSSSRNGQGSTIALVGLGVAAVAALVWWKKGLA